jgi:hypothetical protein
VGKGASPAALSGARAVKHHAARQIVTEEIDGRRVDLALAGQALREADASLLPYALHRWAAPIDVWTETVIALAAAVRRMEAYLPAPAARAAVRVAVEELRRGASA